MSGWKSSEAITADLMGRTASKVECLEASLSVLESEFGVSWVPEAPRLSSGGVQGYLGPTCSRSVWKPGLRRGSVGSVVGECERSNVPLAAKSIQVDRLSFRDAPAFDPLPFLDSRGQSVYDRPLQNALKPGEASSEPPRVRIHATKHERLKLLHKLDKVGRLGFVGAKLVYQGYQNGIPLS